jgi:hypothetical protein
MLRTIFFALCFISTKVHCETTSTTECFIGNTTRIELKTYFDNDIRKVVGAYVRYDPRNEVISLVLFGFASHAQAQEKELSSTTSQVATHCMPDETDYFSCQIEGSLKIASLCGKLVGSSAKNSESPNLEYRFGRHANIEFRFPRRNPGAAAPIFFGEHLEPYDEGVAVDAVLFKSGTASYAILVRDGRDAFTGVSVVAGKRHHDFRCTTKSHVQAFFNLVLSLPPPTN